MPYVVNVRHDQLATYGRGLHLLRRNLRSALKLAGQTILPYTPSHKAAPGNFATAMVTEIAPDVEDSRFIQLSLARLDRFERPNPLAELRAGIDKAEPASPTRPQFAESKRQNSTGWWKLGGSR